MPDYRYVIQSAVNFIEQRLFEKIELESVADKFGYSQYHFMRVFHAFTGYSLKEYIRIRRLAEAAKLILEEDITTGNLYKRIKFESPEAFIRAFKKLYQMTPTEYKKKGRLVHYTPKIKVQRSRIGKGGYTVEYKIKEMPELMVVGIKEEVKHGDNSIKELWNKFLQRLPELEQFKNQPCIGVSIPDGEFCNEEPGPDDKILYMPGVIVDDIDQIPEGFDQHKIAATKYAVFTHKGSLDKLRDTYKYISCEWISKVDYQWTLKEEFEWYDDRFKPEDPDNSAFDIYVPIK